MSAFLKYSQTRRSVVKSENPDMGNTDVSRLLGEMWRNASAAERAPYVEQEQRERAAYKDRIKKWREEQAKLDTASRTSHHAVSQAKVKSVEYPPRAGPPNCDGGYHDTDFEPLRVHSVEDAVGKADQRMFRSYNPAYHQSFGPPYGQVVKEGRDSGLERDLEFMNLHHDNNSTRSRQDFPGTDPHAHPRRNQRPPSHDDDVIRFNGRSVYFSDNMPSFSFYQFP